MYLPFQQRCWTIFSIEFHDDDLFVVKVYHKRRNAACKGLRKLVHKTLLKAKVRHYLLRKTR